MKNNKTKDTKRKFITHSITCSPAHLLTLVACLFTFIPITYAFEDVIVTNNSKLTEIRVGNHEIIDVFPLVTIMNDKNTLIVHPLKEGQTTFSVLKNDKKTVNFSVKVEADETIISPVEGFDILPVDAPPGIFEYELDKPPIKVNK
ncbi:pilus assembly protein N-terminal domain-containing protein [bacterium]|nr:pilus assembly protein N-terminal domain-containing protein [bacterium]